MKVLERLHREPRRETGGAEQAERTGYQFFWGVDRIVALHSQERSYAILFESHEDVVELDDENDATKAVFYQVKSRKSGNWTVGQMTERKKDRKTGKRGSSIAAKMLDGIRRFSTCIERAVLVSNLPMSKLSGDIGEVSFTGLDANLQAEFSSALKEEAPEYDPQHHFPYYYFNYCDLHFSNAEDTVLGRLSRLLLRRTGSESGSKTLLDALEGECRRKSKPHPEARSLSDFEVAHVMKRSDIEACFQIQEKHIASNWAEMSQALHPHISFAELSAVAKAWRTYEVERRRRWQTARIIGPQIAAAADVRFATIRDFKTALDDAVRSADHIIANWDPLADTPTKIAMVLYEYQIR